MDDDPPDDIKSGEKYEFCWGKIDANLVESMRGIRGGDPEPDHPCANCPGDRAYCHKYVGKLVTRVHSLIT